MKAPVALAFVMWLPHSLIVDILHVQNFYLGYLQHDQSLLLHLLFIVSYLTTGVVWSLDSVCQILFDGFKLQASKCQGRLNGFGNLRICRR